jgi:transcriptional regulator with XRE-family HTH domain
MSLFHVKLEMLLRNANMALVSERAGLSPSTLGILLSRKSHVKLQTARALAKVLAVDPEYLTDDSVPSWPPVMSQFAPSPELPRRSKNPKTKKQLDECQGAGRSGGESLENHARRREAGPPAMMI